MTTMLGSEMARTPGPMIFGDHPPKQGDRKFDELPPDEAARRAWIDDGSMPTVLAIRQDAVRELMPTLARALDRLSEPGSRKQVTLMVRPCLRVNRGNALRD